MLSDMMCDNACDRMFKKPHDQMTQKLLLKHHEAAMAEWLRRLTRNQMGSSRVGSNPTRSEQDEKPFLFFGEDKK